MRFLRSILPTAPPRHWRHSYSRAYSARRQPKWLGEQRRRRCARLPGGDCQRRLQYGNRTADRRVVPSEFPVNFGVSPDCLTRRGWFLNARQRTEFEAREFAFGGVGHARSRRSSSSVMRNLARLVQWFRSHSFVDCRHDALGRGLMNHVARPRNTDGTPDGGKIHQLTGVPSAFTPDYAPEEMFEIATKLYKKSR